MHPVAFYVVDFSSLHLFSGFPEGFFFVAGHFPDLFRVNFPFYFHWNFYSFRAISCGVPRFILLSDFSVIFSSVSIFTVMFEYYVTVY